MIRNWKVSVTMNTFESKKYTPLQWYSFIPLLSLIEYVLLQLKTSQYGGSRWWVHFFWSIHVKIDLRIDSSISIRHMATRFGKQVTSRGADSNEINQAGVGDVITWGSRDKTKNIIFPLPECLLPPTKPPRVVTYNKEHLPQSHKITWSRCPEKSRDKWNSLYLHHHKAYDH